MIPLVKFMFTSLLSSEPTVWQWRQSASCATFRCGECVNFVNSLLRPIQGDDDHGVAMQHRLCLHPGEMREFDTTGVLREASTGCSRK